MTDFQKKFPMMQTLQIESEEELEKEYKENLMPKKYKQSDTAKKSDNVKKIYKA